MKLNRFCTHCKTRCEQVYWRPVNGIEFPFCSITHWMAYRKGGEHEKTMADQNEADKTPRKVLPTDFIRNHNEVGPLKQAEMNFERLRGIW